MRLCYVNKQDAFYAAVSLIFLTFACLFVHFLNQVVAYLPISEMGTLIFPIHFYGTG